MKKRMSKEQKQVEAAVKDAYRRLGNGVQVNVFDLGKVLDAGRAAGLVHGDIDAAIAAALQQYRTN